MIFFPNQNYFFVLSSCHSDTVKLRKIDTDLSRRLSQRAREDESKDILSKEPKEDLLNK